MELTKEYFDQQLSQQLSRLVTKEDFDTKLEKLATKQDLFEGRINDKFEKQTRELKAHAERVATDLQEELARMIAESVVTPIYERFDILEKRLDVTDKIQSFERKFDKLEQALDIKL